MLAPSWSGTPIMHGTVQPQPGKVRRRRPAATLVALPAERLIGAARLALAALALIAISIDPVEPARNLAITRTILIAYIAYAALLAAIEAVRTIGARSQIVLHGLDIVAFSVL